MSREPPLNDDVEKLIRKYLEETEVTQDKIVYSQRTAFVYGEENDKMTQIPIEEFLIDILKDKGPITRGTLVSLTNIPRTTLYDVLSKMIMKGKIEKKPVKTLKRGRPKILFAVKKTD
ncbi:MAG: helix-turn-helix domain-containing protein [Candidatus Thorarchaeota archaeon]